MKRKHVADSINRVRQGYAPNWDANLFRALDDVARQVSRELPADKRAEFLKQAGVK